MMICGKEAIIRKPESSIAKNLNVGESRLKMASRGCSGANANWEFTGLDKVTEHALSVINKTPYPKKKQQNIRYYAGLAIQEV